MVSAKELYDYLLRMGAIPDDKVLLIVDFYVLDSEEKVKIRKACEGLLCKYEFIKDCNDKLIMFIKSGDDAVFIKRLIKSYGEFGCPFDISIFE